MALGQSPDPVPEGRLHVRLREVEAAQPRGAGHEPEQRFAAGAADGVAAQAQRREGAVPLQRRRQRAGPGVPHAVAREVKGPQLRQPRHQRRQGLRAAVRDERAGEVEGAEGGRREGTVGRQQPQYLQSTGWGGGGGRGMDIGSARDRPAGWSIPKFMRAYIIPHSIRVCTCIFARILYVTDIRTQARV